MSFADRAGRPRNPKDIATEILALEFPDRRRPPSFKDILDEVSDTQYAVNNQYSIVDEPKGSVARISNSRNEFELLTAALETISKGADPNELRGWQKTAIRQSQRLVDLLINHAEFMGGMGHDGSASLDIQDKILVDFASKNTEKSAAEIEADQRNDYAEQAKYYASHIQVYRTKIIPLLEELAGALHIPFDKPRDGRA